MSSYQDARYCRGDSRTVLTDDTRPIRAVHAEEGVSYVVGKQGISKIEAYSEMGEYSCVPWLAVFVDYPSIGERIKYRMPARNFVVEYFYGED